MRQLSLSPHEAQWISLIRYQMSQAHQQAEQPSPLSSLALSTMQDAAESVIRLCAERLGVTLAARDDFDSQVAKVLAGAGRSQLGAHTSSLRAMNRARVGFKHSGNRADDTTVRQHLAATYSAIAGYLKEVFDVEFSDVSMLVLVADPDVRDRLSLAQWHRDRNDGANAASDLAMAMAILLDSHHGEGLGWRSFISMSPEAHFRDADVEDFLKRSEVGHRLLEYDEWLRRLDERIVLLSAGVETVSYLRFESIVGILDPLPEGGFGMSTATGPIDDDEWSWAMQFVIETSLRFAEKPLLVQPARGERVRVERSATEDAKVLESYRVARRGDKPA